MAQNEDAILYSKFLSLIKSQEWKPANSCYKAVNGIHLNFKDTATLNDLIAVKNLFSKYELNTTFIAEIIKQHETQTNR